MTGFESKRQAAQAKLDVAADTSSIVYQRGFADSKKAAQPEQQAEPDRWEIEKVDNKLFLNGKEIGPGTVDVRLDGLTFRASEKVEVRQQVKPEQEPVAWPCLIDTADFSAGIVTLAMQCEDYKVSPDTHWLSTTPPTAQRKWVGLTDEDKCKPDLGEWVELNEDWLDGYQTGLEFANKKLKERNT